MTISIRFFILIMLVGCNGMPTETMPPAADSIILANDTVIPVPEMKTELSNTESNVIDTRNIERSDLLQYAKTLLGVPYKYASSDPVQGFDCSGFITYVFNHFKITVPRSSVDFTNVGKEVKQKEARVGDLILFTGTDSLIRVVGHMGIITENSDSIRFIHSTSGKADGVTITTLNNYYQGRFVKVIDIFGGS